MHQNGGVTARWSYEDIASAVATVRAVVKAPSGVCVGFAFVWLLVLDVWAVTMVIGALWC